MDNNIIIIVSCPRSIGRQFVRGSTVFGSCECARARARPSTERSSRPRRQCVTRSRPHSRCTACVNRTRRVSIKFRYLWHHLLAIVFGNVRCRDFSFWSTNHPRRRTTHVRIGKIERKSCSSNAIFGFIFT